MMIDGFDFLCIIGSANRQRCSLNQDGREIGWLARIDY